VSGKNARTARLVHQHITTVHGGPHVGDDTLVDDIATAAPVRLSLEGWARLTCALEGCGRIYDVQLLTAKQRLLTVLKRALIVSAVMASGSLMAQLGTWVYDQGRDSQLLRVLGGGLTGAGVVINLLVLLLTLMTFWFWPARYKLSPVESDGSPSDKPVTIRSRYSGSRIGHRVKIRRVKT
jgi:hypothetical protein